MARRRRYNVRWTPGELEALRPPDIDSCSAWADRYRFLDRSAGAQGKMRLEVTPYIRGIMDAMSDPQIPEMTVVKGTQLGLTEAAMTFLGFIVDQDPGPTLLVYPRKEDVKYIIGSRIKAMVKANPQVARHLSSLKRDLTQLAISFDRMTVFFAASTAAADLAMKAIRYLIMDELDRYESWLPGEGSPIELARGRLRTFYDAKMIKFSSPTTEKGNIWLEWLQSDRRRFWCQCPKCHHWKWPTWSQVKWPYEIKEPDRIKHGRMAEYECPHCGHRIADGGEERRRFIASGVWAPEDAISTVEGPRGGTFKDHAGFHLPALLSPWTSWSELAALWMQKHKSVDSLQEFVNQQLAEPWTETTKKCEPEQLRALVIPATKQGEIPRGVQVLTAGVDVQQDHFYAVVRGWGARWESWLIAAKRLESWTQLVDEIFMGKWDGRTASMICIDAGYDPWTVYDYALAYPDFIRPTKGASHQLPVLYRTTVIEKNKHTGHIYPGGLVLWVLNTLMLKDKILRLQGGGAPKVEGPDTAGSVYTGGWHLPEDLPPDYFLQITNEERKFERNRKTGKGRWAWVPKYSGAPAHYFDCETMALAAADMLGVGSGELEEPAPQKKIIRTGASDSGGFRRPTKGGWFSWK